MKFTMKEISAAMSQMGRKGGKIGGKVMSPARLASQKANAQKPRPKSRQRRKAGV